MAALGPLVVEAADPESLTRFWVAALGEEAFTRLLVVEPERQRKAVKNRVHFDVHVPGAPALLRLGARVLAQHSPARITMADVEGNEFCAFVEPEFDHQPPAQVFAVCTDSDRPAEAAAWWAPLVGADIGPGPDGVPRYLRGCAGWEGLIWKFVEVHDRRVTPNRWRWTVAVGADELLAAGAETTKGCLIDPQGNEINVGSRAHRAG